MRVPYSLPLGVRRSLYICPVSFGCLSSPSERYGAFLVEGGFSIETAAPVAPIEPLAAICYLRRLRRS